MGKSVDTKEHQAAGSLRVILATGLASGGATPVAYSLWAHHAVAMEAQS